jgi:hypothetical protein
MNIRIILSFFLTVFPFIHHFGESASLVREIQFYGKDTVFKHTFFYDDNRNKVVENVFVQKDGISLPFSRTECLYDNDFCHTQRESKWINNQWIQVKLVRNSRENNRKSKSEFIRINNALETVEKTVSFSYNGDKLQSYTTYQGVRENNQVLNGLINTFDNQGRVGTQEIYASGINAEQRYLYRYTYNNAGQNDSVVLYTKENNTLIPSQLTVFLYYKYSNNIRIQTLKNYNPLSKRWINATRTEFVYNNNNQLLSETYFESTVMYWAPVLKYVYVYDNTSHLLEKNQFKALYNKWRLLSTVKYSNFNNNQPNLVESKYQFWGGETGNPAVGLLPYYMNDEIQLKSAHKIVISYVTDLTVITDSQHDEKKISIYPNPSNGVFYINAGKFNVQKWELYDLRGTLLQKDELRLTSGVIDLTGTPAGVYILKVFSGDNQHIIQRIVINY